MADECEFTDVDRVVIEYRTVFIVLRDGSVAKYEAQDGDYDSGAELAEKHLETWEQVRFGLISQAAYDQMVEEQKSRSQAASEALERRQLEFLRRKYGT